MTFVGDEENEVGGVFSLTSPALAEADAPVPAPPTNPPPKPHRRPPREALSPEMTLLSSFDSRLVEVLARGEIRLIRAAWLRRKKPTYRLQRRQILEQKPHALLSCEEAVELLLMGKRAIGVLSHPWLSASSPDPEGVHLEAVQHALADLKHVEALFWDIGCLHQARPRPCAPAPQLTHTHRARTHTHTHTHTHTPCTRMPTCAPACPPVHTYAHQVPRTEAEEASFDSALTVMADLYASAVGTSVLQLREVPERPERMEGVVCMQHLAAGTTLRHLRAAVATSCVGALKVTMASDDAHAHLRFRSDEEASEMMASGSEEIRKLCADVVPLYNDASFDQRGWLTFESSISMELLLRVIRHPRLQTALLRMPHKVFAHMHACIHACMCAKTL